MGTVAAAGLEPLLRLCRRWQLGAATMVAGARLCSVLLSLLPLVLLGEFLSEVVGLRLHSDEPVANQHQNVKMFDVIDRRKVSILRCREEASPVGLFGVLAEHSGPFMHEDIP